MISYVIGNGFDLHYKLPTGYNNFKQYLIENGHWEIVNKVDNLFWERGDFNPRDIETWSDFETMLQVFNNLSPYDLYDEAFDNAETDDDRAGFWDSPSWNAHYYNEYIKILKHQFNKWINEMDTTITPDTYFHPHAGDSILTFNYTTTIEDNYDVQNIRITHIHGTKNEKIILGHNSKPNPELFTIIENEESDYRDVTTKKAVNDVLKKASKSYYKNSNQILAQHNSLFCQIPLFSKVVIMGLSCGEQDEAYIQAIVQHATIVDFYYYDNAAKDNFENIVGVSNVIINYYKW